MNEPRCEHCDLPLDMCPHGTGAKELDAPETFFATMDRAINARYGGSCGHCGAHYDVDDLITKAAPDDGSAPVWCRAAHADNSRW